MPVLVARRCVVFLLFFLSLAGAQGADEPPPATAPSAAASTITLVFDESAAALPQVAIRAALERELGVPVVLEPSSDRSILRVSVAPDGEIRLIYQRRTELLERSLPGPQRPEQVPLLISLAAGTLVHNQSGELAPWPDTPSSNDAPAPPPPAPTTSVAPPSQPVTRAERPASQTFANLFGVRLGVDLAIVSVSNACTPDARERDSVVCYLPNGSTFTGNPSISAAGAVASGLTAATVPVLISYERVFGWFGAEVRAGYAFNGGPRPLGGKAFLPLRLELRGKLWPYGAPRSTAGLRSYAHLGVGVAQVDTKIDATVVDCSTAPTDRVGFFANCLTSSNAADAKGFGGTGVMVTVVKTMGLGYVTAGGGVAYTIAGHHGIVLDLNLMVLFPSNGVVLEPSLGYQIGI